ncbi:hypothetical protein [Streptomyces coelicoflavus]|uniref:hypothetical protein n=1 Tax=Streptomyces coelicoflavus TaxID=285562 RepID=UPI000D597F92|nr:hypothetical protein [Streptomyces coelicoflavus]
MGNVRGTGGERRHRDQKLRMVASMVPDSVHYPMDDYLKEFRKRAFECFEVLYDTVEPIDVTGAT